jgi:hypothetical protein
MKQNLLTFIVLIGLVIPAINVQAQEADPGYNPFVPVNLDDEGKLPLVPVVESAYHYYTVVGDANFTAASTFVWYVENGTFGTYDRVTDVWTPITPDGTISNGEYIEIPGTTISAVPNSSEIWVQWDDGSGGSTGYIAVYERSSTNCVVEDQITGFKHNILVPPQAWFLVGERFECADQTYAVTVQFNELHENSAPYTLSYSYPGYDGFLIQADTTFTLNDLTANQLTWDLPAVADLDITADDSYVITLDLLRDRFGSTGHIAPEGPPTQFGEIEITIYHLPRTGAMEME